MEPEQTITLTFSFLCPWSATSSWQPYRNSHGQIVFPTKEEAAYPKLLCERVACILKSEAVEQGFSFADDLEELLHQRPQAAARQLFTAQPRAHRLKPLVSEYGYYTILLNQ